MTGSSEKILNNFRLGSRFFLRLISIWTIIVTLACTPVRHNVPDKNLPKFGDNLSSERELNSDYTTQLRKAKSNHIALKFRTLSLTERGVSNDFKAQLRKTKSNRLHAFVHLSAPANQKVRKTLASQGVTLLFRVEKPIWVATVQRKAVRASILPKGVEWIGSIRPQDKISEQLTTQIPKWARSENGMLRVAVEFYDDISRKQANKLLTQVAGKIDPWGIGNGYYVLLSRTGISILAADDRVKWITPGPLPFLPLNNFTRRITGVDELQELELGPGGTPPIEYHGHTGTGVQIGIFDSGIDPDHLDFRRHNTAGVEIGNRLLRHSLRVDAHGTQVAGVAAADGFSGALCGEIPYLKRGMAPGADLISVTPHARFGASVNDFVEGIVDFGMDLSNHSYAQGWNGNYGWMTRRVDELIYGTTTSSGVPVSVRPQIWAAGNSGVYPVYFTAEGYFSVFAAAKNAIAVGATIADTVGAHDHLARFSSLGPTWDGRIKPEIMAPGDGINTTQRDTGCYTSQSGTSLSAPAVAGISALVYEQYAETYRIELDVDPPLPSTLKAILVQSADDLSHTVSDRHDWNNPDTESPVLYHLGPDWATGYGRINANGAVGVTTEKNLRQGSIADDGMAVIYPFHVAPLSGHTQFTLAWDDPPDEDTFGSETTPRLINDLDLTVIAPDGTELLPWVLPALTPAEVLGEPDPISPADITAATRGRDHLNNLEQITIRYPSMPGEWQVRVSVSPGTMLQNGISQSFSVAGDFHGTIHFCDWNNTPGTVYAIRKGAPVNIFTDPTIRRIYHSAFAPDDGRMYVSNANSDTVLVAHSDGEGSDELYRHSTYLRDIGFDPEGRFYFSESTGAGGDGIIYELDLSSRTASFFYRVKLTEVDGFWAGDFAFDRSGVLYLSTGNRIGSRIYRIDNPAEATPPVTVYSLAGESITGIAFDRDNQLFLSNWGGGRGYIWRLNLGDSRRDLVYSFADRYIWDISFR